MAACAGGLTFFIRMSRLCNERPYSSRFSSTSFRSVDPLSEIPAKTPCERDHYRMPALMKASVFADVDRPTGPAATDAEPPKVNLSSSNCLMPRRDITSMMTSVDSAPI